jgi:sigma-B regulation protein RsbU (phosphoserine phosphatase)
MHTEPSTPDALQHELEQLRREAEQLRRAVYELSILNDLAREISAAGTAQAVMDSLVRRALKAVGAEQGVLSLMDEEASNPLRTLIRTGPDSRAQRPLQINQSLLGWMQRHGQPLVIDDPAQDPRFSGVPWDASIRSVLCVPLTVQGRLTGILTVFNKTEGSVFAAEDRRLLSILAAQSAQVIENARLQEEEQALLRMRQELQVAQQIQINLLPDPLPTVPGYDVAGASWPAQQVGGDYFDVIPMEDERFVVCVGDVVGKGLPASLLMATVQATLRALAPVAGSVEAMLSQASRLLYQSTSRGRFVTLFGGLLDAEQHRLTYGNAGHNRPLLLRADGTMETLRLGGLALGAVAAATYQEATVSLAPGDVLLLFSDGVVEAMNARREPFGDDRLAAVLAAHRHASARELIDQIAGATQAHAGTAPQSDDLTLLALRRLASSS